ncbi:MAG: hypothetical protein AVDCRST_MAG66-2037, partial [uncultured Pseudonocardia sp.]
MAVVEPTAIDPAGPATTVPGARAAARAGLAAIGLCTGLVLALHVLAPDPGPAHTMISNYALGGYRPLFDLGVLVLVAGSAAVVAALVATGAVRPGGAATRLLLTWCAGMVLVVAFPTTSSTLPPTPEAVVHATGAVAAFAALPLGALAAAREWRAVHARHAAVLRALAALSLALLVPVLGGIAPGSPLAVQ